MDLVFLFVLLITVNGCLSRAEVVEVSVVRKSPDSRQECENEIRDLSMFKSQYRNSKLDMFVGIGIGCSVDSADASDIARLKAQGDLCKTAKSEIVSITERLTREVKYKGEINIVHHFRDELTGLTDIRLPHFTRPVIRKAWRYGREWGFLVTVEVSRQNFTDLVRDNIRDTPMLELVNDFARLIDKPNER